MAPPPAKRQRRSKPILRDSDDEDEATLRVRQTTLTPEREPSVRTVSRPTRPRKSLDSNGVGPALKTTKSPKKSEEKENIKSLHSFFGRATEEQRWTRKVDTPAAEGKDVEDEDTIEDDEELLNDALLELADTQNDTRLVLDRRKGGTSAVKHGNEKKRMAAPSSNQKFVKPLAPVKTFENASTRPWAETYGPRTLEELAVHRKKVADVQKWLGDVFSGRDRRVCDPRTDLGASVRC
jgi:cell cycle checkpoint protein